MEISRARIVHSNENKDPRLVVMPMHINKFIICEQEQTGLTQKQIREGGVSLYKTVMDLKSAYKMQALDEQSQLKCIFTTDIGVFQPLRVNFGFKDSPSAFLKHLRTLLGDIPYVTWWMDDLYIYAPEIIHEDIVCTVLERLEKANMKISLEKCQFMKKEVEYLNMDMDHYAMQLLFKKRMHFANLKEPKSLKEIKNLIHSTQHWSAYIPEFSEITAKFYEKNTFSFDDEDKLHFKKLVNALANCIPIHFVRNSNEEFRITTKVTKYAYSYAIAQGRRIFNLGGRKFKNYETRYSEVEKTAVAIKEALLENSNTINGLTTIIEMEDSSKRKLFKNIPEMQFIQNRLMRITMNFAFFNLIFQPPSELNIFTQLLMDTVPEIEDDKINDYNLFTMNMNDEKTIVGFQLNLNDEELLNGYKDDIICKQLIDKCKQQLTLKDEMKLPKLLLDQEWKLDNNIIKTKDGKIYIPLQLRHKVLQFLHQYHSSDTTMIRTAQQSIIYENMTSDLKRLYYDCKTCQKFKRNKNYKITSWSQTQRALERVHIDHFKIKDKWILLIVNAYSNHLHLSVCKDQKAETIIQQLSEYCGLYGVPTIIASDNYRSFNGNELSKFAEDNFIILMSSIPYSSYTNGQAEKYVDYAKRQIVKFMDNNHSLKEAIKLTMMANKTLTNKNGISVTEAFFNQTINKQAIINKYSPRFIELNKNCNFKIKPSDTNWTEHGLCL